jgi:hypothetical protein
MEKALAFLWLIWFTRLELGSRNSGTRFHVNVHLPLSGFDSKSEPASDSEDFTLTTNEFFEWQSTVLCQGLLWKSHHFLVSLFVFLMFLFSCDLDWLSDTSHLFSVLSSIGWGHPFLVFAVRDS